MDEQAKAFNKHWEWWSKTNQDSLWGFVHGRLTELIRAASASDVHGRLTELIRAASASAWQAGIDWQKKQQIGVGETLPCKDCALARLIGFAGCSKHQGDREREALR